MKIKIVSFFTLLLVSVLNAQTIEVCEDCPVSKLNDAIKVAKASIPLLLKKGLIKNTIF
jgi:nitrous oxidase accessory protein